MSAYKLLIVVDENHKHRVKPRARVTAYRWECVCTVPGVVNCWTWVAIP
jgi:hypothetical protein